MRTRPKSFGNSWPMFSDMTAAEQQQLLNELQQENRLKDYYAEQNRTRIMPSADDVYLMDEALAWPMRYLQGDRDLALITTGWADGLVRSPYEATTPELVTQGLAMIAAGLIRDRVRVR